MLIDILIPTYNRAPDLAFNLNLLCNYINKGNLHKDIRIIISDNCSPDNTSQVVSQVQSQESNIEIVYYQTEENIGLERNAVHILSKATSEYILWLGDDDYLPIGYLDYAVKKLKSDVKIGGILPRNCTIENHTEFVKVENLEDQTEIYSKGYKSMFALGHFSHQMSGIILKRKNLLDSYLHNDKWRNVYLFMYFTNYCFLNYDMIFAPHYKVSITAGNAKAWSYDSAGLLPEVYKSYYYFLDKIGEQKVIELIFDFTRRHSWRFGIDVFKPLESYRRFTFLMSNTEELINLKKRLKLLFFKDYLYRLKNKVSFIR